MKHVIVLIPLLSFALAALSPDSGWQLQDRIKSGLSARRDGFEGFRGIFPQPDGVPADYVMWYTVDEAIVSYQNLDGFDISLIITESQSNAWFDGLRAEAQALADGAGSYMDPDADWDYWNTPLVVRNKLVISASFQMYDVNPDTDNNADFQGEIMMWFIVDIATKAVESHFMAPICANRGGVHTQLAYETDDAFVLFSGHASEWNPDSCHVWYGFILLNKDGSGGDWLPGGAVTTLGLPEWQDRYVEDVFRYDVENDPAGKMEEWGNPKGVIWVIFREKVVNVEGPDDVIISVLALKVSSDGVPSLEWHEELDPLIPYVGTLWVNAGDSGDVMGIQASATDYDVMTQVVLMHKTLDRTQLLADRKAWHSAGPGSLSSLRDLSLLGSFSDSSLIGVVEGHDSVSGPAPAIFTFFVEDGEIATSNPEEDNCQPPFVTDFEGESNYVCVHYANVALWEKNGYGINRRMKKIADDDTVTTAVVDKVCGEAGCKLYFSGFQQDWFVEMILQDKIVVIPSLYTIFFGAALVGGGSYGYRARVKRNGKAAIGKHAAALDAASPSTSETGEGLLATKRPVPGSSKRSSTGSKRGSGASHRSERRSGGSRRSKRGSTGSKRASTGSKRASTGSKRASTGSKRASTGSKRCAPDAQ